MPEAIDLGIKVNGKTIKWASCNLGASNPEDYGDYYAWGETAPYYSSQSPLTWKNGKSAGYSWASYKWCGGFSSTLTKYNTKESCGVVDNITELQRGEKSGETVDDAARAKLGGKWRIPTDAEWTELRTKCTWTWVTNYNGSGINGRLITATNGNSIFLPAAGYRYDTNLNDAGSYGLYWSSSLNTDGPYYTRGTSTSIPTMCTGTATTVTTGNPFVQFQNNRTARAFWPSRPTDCVCDQH